MNWLQDIRFAFRMIGRNPWFSAAIVVTLALGMGVNTTVFSLVNAVLFKPLPFPGGDRLVMAGAANLPANREFMPVSYSDFRDFREGAGSFERLEAFSGRPITIGERGNPPERYRGALVSAGMFEMLGVRPVLGRGLTAADEKAGAEKVVLISHGVWKDRYGMAQSVIGRTVRANEEAATIAGVMPEGFKFPNNEDLWMAAVPTAQNQQRRFRDFMMIGVIKPDASVSAAQADLNVVAKRLERQYPDTHKDHTVEVRTFHEAMNGGPIRIVFLLMLGAVGFVLLIACANVANMLLSRAVDRSREMSIRAAMGASRWRVIRQLLIESIVLSAAGGAIGLFIARFGTGAFGRAVENVGKPYWIDFSMDYVVFGYFAALTILAGIVFGIAPAVSASRVNLNETLKEGARSSAGRRGGYLSGALVVFQFTLALVLLSGAGLMMRSFLLAQSEFSEMNGGQVLMARVSLPTARYGKPEERQRFYETLMPRLASLAGVRSAAMVSNAPGSGGAGWRFEIEGKLIAEAQRRPAATGVLAGENYFRLLGVSLLRGRDFSAADGLPGKEAVIVTQQFAGRFFPNQDPLGRQIRIYSDENQPRAWMTIVGVAPDIRQRNPSEQANDPVIFVPYRFQSWPGMAVLLRTQGPASAMTAALRAEVQQLDQDLPLFEVRTLQEHFDRQRWFLPVFGSLFLIFAMIALGMAAVGIYAVMSQAAGRRTREIGVRMALGAGVGSILGLVLRRGIIQLGLGLVLGMAAAFAVTRLMARILLFVSPTDPVTFVVVPLTLAAAGIAATWLPARRAARLDPVKALRYE